MPVSFEVCLWSLRRFLHLSCLHLLFFYVDWQPFLQKCMRKCILNPHLQSRMNPRVSLFHTHISRLSSLPTVDDFDFEILTGSDKELLVLRKRERERERNTFLFVKSILQVLFGDFKASCAWHAWIKGSLDEKSLPVIFVVKWPFFLVLMRETPLFRWWILSSLRLTFSWNNLHDRLTNEIAIHYLGLSLLILSCLEESSLRAFVSKEQLQWFIRCLLFPHELLHFTLSSTRMQFPSRLTN